MTTWQFPQNGVRVDLYAGLGGYLAQLRLLTVGTTDEIAARVQEIGPDDARSRLRDAVACDVKIGHYGKVRAEADAIAQQIHGLQATASRLYAERAELLAHAAPGFAAKVAAVDRRAAEAEAKIAEAKENQEAIRTTVARAKQDAVAAVQLVARDVSARVTWELGIARDSAIGKIAAAIGPILTEFASLGQAHLLALGGGLVGDVGALVEELAAAQEEATIR